MAHGPGVGNCVDNGCTTGRNERENTGWSGMKNVSKT